MQAYAPGASSLLDSFAVCPQISALHPEYISSTDILSCPSDTDSLSLLSESTNLPEVRLLSDYPWLAGRSYGYLGYVFDKADRPLVRGGEFHGLRRMEILLGRLVRLSTRPLNAQIASALDAQVRDIESLTVSPIQVQTLYDRDIMAVAVHPVTGENLGNGSSSIIYRLREGIGRFLVEDMHTASSSRAAESAIWVMFDQPNTKPHVALNHHPGGSNVLFMDGHVEYIPFIRGAKDMRIGTFGDEGAIQPVSPSMLYTLGVFANLR